jgi:SMI1 / KNR4 family (SUKH-1)
MSLNKRILEYWRTNGVASYGGTSVQEIAAFESKHDATIPKDLRDFLIEFDGNLDMAGKDYFRFLHLHDFASSDKACEMQFGEAFDTSYPHVPNGFFVFADFLQWCYGYAIQLGTGAEQNVVVLIGGLTCLVVANSFSEFIEMYLRDDPKLHPGLKK